MIMSKFIERSHRFFVYGGILFLHYRLIPRTDREPGLDFIVSWIIGYGYCKGFPMVCGRIFNGDLQHLFCHYGYNGLELWRKEDCAGLVANREMVCNGDTRSSNFCRWVWLDTQSLRYQGQQSVSLGETGYSSTSGTRRNNLCRWERPDTQVPPVPGATVCVAGNW